jgi:hypothetical protein
VTGGRLFEIVFQARIDLEARPLRLGVCHRISAEVRATQRARDPGRNLPLAIGAAAALIFDRLICDLTGGTRVTALRKCMR